MKKTLLFILLITAFAGYSQTFDNIPIIAPGSSSRVLINKAIASPGGPDLTNEYYEFRGTPNAVVPSDLYFIAIEGDGDSAANMGRIRDAVKLGDGVRTFGSNGILALVANYTNTSTNAVTTNPYSSVISANANVIVIELQGPDVTSGSSAAVTAQTPDIGFDGNLLDQTAAYMLIQAASTDVATLRNIDIDSDNDGIIDNSGDHTSWSLHDSFSLIDNDDSFEYGYGQIAFVRAYTGNEANFKITTSATIVPIDSSSPVYALRQGASTGFTANDWIASAIGSGSVPNFMFNSTSVSPSAFASYEMPNSIYGELNPTEASLSVAEDVFKSSLSIYPNPAKNYITVKSKDIKIESVEIFNMLGKSILKGGLVDDGINVSNLPTGVYMLKVNSNSSSSIRRIVLN